MAKVDIALRRFDTVTRYYSYETTMYWARSHFFLVANAALLGFTASSLINPNVNHPYLLSALCVFGALLSVLWYLTLRIGQYWTDRWERLCVILEPIAFGRLEMFRNCRSPWQVSTKKIARMTAWLFICVWVIAALYAVRTDLGLS